MAITNTVGENLDHTLTALRMSGLANAVSKAHLKTLLEIWKNEKEICEIISITNAQNYLFWHDEELYNSLAINDDNAIIQKKTKGKNDYSK